MVQPLFKLSTFVKPESMALIALIVVLGAIHPATAATLYKWIDDDGQIRYSDQIPPQQVTKKHEKLNAHGIVVDTKEAAKTKEALEAERKAKREADEASAKQKAAEDRVIAAQERRDKVLLLTFSSEEELAAIRDNRIDVVDSVITLINKSIGSTQEKLLELETQADKNWISKDLEVPGGLAQKIEHQSRKIETSEEILLLKYNEKQKIIEQFDSDIIRYRELTTL
jgi:uncharacterized caspase-like protein